MKNKHHLKILTVGSLIGLFLGLVGGIAAHASQFPVLLTLAAIVEPIGTMWINALTMTILPLVVSHLIVAVASMSNTRNTGKVGGIALLVYMVLFGFGVVLTLGAMPFVNTWFTIDPEALAALQENASSSLNRDAVTPAQRLGFADWFVGLIPANPIQAAAQGKLLPIVVCTLLFGLAIARLAEKQRQPLLRFFEAIAEATLVLVGWILLLIPVGVFALAFAETTKTGLATLGMIGFFIAVICGLSIIYMLALYPITAIMARIPLRRFAWGALPAQAVAVGTRSSLASLPALLEGAKERLKLPAHVADLVLPLSVSAFKANIGIKSIAKFLFLAYLFGIDVGIGFMVLFIVSISALSFSVPGIPSGGSMLILPFFLDAGIPLEAFMLLQAVNAIPDIVMTTLNVTTDLSVATITNRFVKSPDVLPMADPHPNTPAFEEITVS